MEFLWISEQMLSPRLLCLSLLVYGNANAGLTCINTSVFPSTEAETRILDVELHSEILFCAQRGSGVMRLLCMPQTLEDNIAWLALIFLFLLECLNTRHSLTSIMSSKQSMTRTLQKRRWCNYYLMLLFPIGRNVLFFRDLFQKNICVFLFYRCILVRDLQLSFYSVV